MAGFKFGCTSTSGYATCDMDCELEIASPILLGTNDYSGAGGGTGPVYAKRSAILDYSVQNRDVLMGAFIINTSSQVPTFYDTFNWTSGYNKLLGKDGIQTGNYHGYFGYVSSGNLKNAYNDANIPIFTDPDEFFAYLNPVATYTSNGGGATHIAKVTGQLKDLSSNLSDILMVSGGGGGGLLVGENAYAGADAGGISGSGDNSADQSTGNAFGQGESGTDVSGGGSGLYGGYKGTSAKSGGAGSGYIGNSLLSNKKMVGYNVPTSSAESTKTESINDVSASAVSGKPKSGNGFARIKFLREPPSLSYKNTIILPENSYSVKGKNTETTYTMIQIKQTFSNNNIILLLYDTNGYIALPMPASSGWALKMASGQYAKNDGQLDWFYGFNNTANPLYPHYLSGGSMPVSWSLQYTTIDNVQYYDDAYTGGTEEHPAILICSLSEFDIYKDGIFDRHYINS